MPGVVRLAPPYKIPVALTNEKYLIDQGSARMHVSFFNLIDKNTRRMAFVPAAVSAERFFFFLLII